MVPGQVNRVLPKGTRPINPLTRSDPLPGSHESGQGVVSSFTAAAPPGLEGLHSGVEVLDVASVDGRRGPLPLVGPPDGRAQPLPRPPISEVVGHGTFVPTEAAHDVRARLGLHDEIHFGLGELRLARAGIGLHCHARIVSSSDDTSCVDPRLGRR